MASDAPSSAGASVREEPRPGTFRRRLALAFATVAAITAALSAGLLSYVWNQQFDQYLRDTLRQAATDVSQTVGAYYAYYGGWSAEMAPAIPRFSTLAIQILDGDGNVIYDDSFTRKTTQEGAQDVVIEPEGPVVTAPVRVLGRQVGSVRMWAVGGGAMLTERDEQFRQRSFIALTVAALVAIAASSLAGAWYAGMLVRPIAVITSVAQSLRSGDRTARTRLTGPDEIALLGMTFDEMADAIEADRELERRLTADVAHELRTPLQAIQATVEAMQDGVLPADEERLGVVRDETVRLSRLADAILELTRLERGSLAFEMKRLDAAAPVRASVDALQALIESRELTLSVDLGEGLYVQADSDRLQQAVSNLLSNAARYTKPGGRIEVHVWERAGQVVIDVKDTGVGIAPEDMPHVFNRFWRADTSRATASGGLGIGLAVTREIVERHGGTIEVDSAWGTGSVFTIRLPRVA